MNAGVLSLILASLVFYRIRVCIPLLLNTELYDRNHMLYTIPAILLQPFVDDCHQTADMKLHHILLILLGNLETIQNRSQYMTVQRSVSVIHPQDDRLLHGCLENAAMLLNIHQIRRQILRRNQVQLIQRTFLQLFQKLYCIIRAYTLQTHL